MDTQKYLSRLLSEIGNKGTRIAFSEEETQAKLLLISEMKKEGLEVFTDKAGNLYGIHYVNENEKKSTTPLTVSGIGSHVDSVPDGGNYDGLVGILCGLAAYLNLKEQGALPSKNIVITALECEESSVFGKSCLGSKLIAGKIDVQTLHSIPTISEIFQLNGKTYGQKWQQCHQQLNVPLLTRPLIWDTFLEAHIEQGPALVDSGNVIGVVSDIAAPCRVKFTLTGKGGHDGTVPMEKRRDALVGFNELYNIYRNLRRIWHIGDTLRTNMGVVEIENASINKIPRRLSTTISARGLDKQFMIDFMDELIKRIERELPAIGITVETERLETGTPIHLQEGLVAKIRQAAQHLPCMEMWSGAGHDTAYMHSICKNGSAVFFIPNTGISHEPTEYASVKDMEKAVEVLTNVLKEV